MKILNIIKEAYYEINKYVGHKHNTKILREEVKSLLEIKLRHVGVWIVCDETNNPCDILDANLLNADIYYENKCLNLIFGDIKMIWEND